MCIQISDRAEAIPKGSKAGRTQGLRWGGSLGALELLPPLSAWGVVGASSSSLSLPRGSACLHKKTRELQHMYATSSSTACHVKEKVLTMTVMVPLLHKHTLQPSKLYCSVGIQRTAYAENHTFLQMALHEGSAAKMPPQRGPDQLPSPPPVCPQADPGPAPLHRAAKAQPAGRAGEQSPSQILSARSASASLA